MPEYGPRHQWCCRACQESHQLECVMTTPAAPEAVRSSATTFLAHMRAIGSGRYGGVEIGNLFD